jgi:protein TonB
LTVAWNQLVAQQPTYSPTPPIVQIPPNAKRAKAIAIFAPKPDYPKYARDHHWTGVGWFVMHVDVKSGYVQSVEVTQSTGHKMLDEAVVTAFSRWRFEPGKAAPRIKSPVTFSKTD